jgi:hypothetical protein
MLLVIPAKAVVRQAHGPERSRRTHHPEQSRRGIQNIWYFEDTKLQYK